MFFSNDSEWRPLDLPLLKILNSYFLAFFNIYNWTGAEYCIRSNANVFPCFQLWYTDEVSLATKSAWPPSIWRHANCTCAKWATRTVSSKPWPRWIYFDRLRYDCSPFRCFDLSILITRQYFYSAGFVYLFISINRIICVNSMPSLQLMFV